MQRMKCASLRDGVACFVLISTWHLMSCQGFAKHILDSAKHVLNAAKHAVLMLSVLLHIRGSLLQCSILRII